MQKIKLDKNVECILDTLNGNGYESYLVGGAVRDYLLCGEASDFDITTSAEPDEIHKCFESFKIADTGIKHGTVTVVIDGVGYEITTFRTEQGYSDNRRPDKVAFTKSLEEDLKRRDFTINALCYSPKSGLIDLFNGIQDLNDKIIRAVGEPSERFNEDALRILRAVRLSAKLGFTLDEDTRKAMFSKKGLLNKVSVERIYTELVKLLQGKFRALALREYHEIILEILPTLKDGYNFEQLSRSHKSDVYGHTVDALEISDTDDTVVSFAILFHDSGKPKSFILGKDGFGHYPDHFVYSQENAISELTRLKAPNNVLNEVSALVYCHDDIFNELYQVRELVGAHGIEFAKRLAKIKRADVYSHSEFGIIRYSPFFENYIKHLTSIIDNRLCCSLKELAVNGDDLIEIGVEPQKIGQALSYLLKLVVKDELTNDKAALVSEAKSFFCKNI